MPAVKTAAALATVSIFLLGGCNLSEREPLRWPTDAELEQYNATVTPEERIICRDETPVGTRISQRVCRRVGDVDETSDLTQREFRRIIR